jgi:hypothetical protein
MTENIQSSAKKDFFNSIRHNRSFANAPPRRLFGMLRIASTLRSLVRLRAGGSTRHGRHPAKGKGKS